jgi:hypothetical protein
MITSIYKKVTDLFNVSAVQIVAMLVMYGQAGEVEQHGTCFKACLIGFTKEACFVKKPWYLYASSNLPN